VYSNYQLKLYEIKASSLSQNVYMVILQVNYLDFHPVLSHGHKCDFRLPHRMCGRVAAVKIRRWIDRVMKRGLTLWRKNKIIYLLHPWSRALLQKLIVTQLVKKFPAFYGTRSFI